MSAFPSTVGAATYAAQWQSKMFYCYFTDDEYGLDEVEVDSSDSDDDTRYGNRRDVCRVSGKSREDGLELQQVLNWISAFAKMVEGPEWPSSLTSRLGYCPCSHHRSDWRITNNLYACEENRGALDGHSENIVISGDKASRAPSFKVGLFIAHCKDFAVN